MISFRGLQQSTIGILCILLAFACFSTQDMLFKWLTPYYAIPAVHLFRIAFSVSITLMFLLPLEARRAKQSLVATARIRQPWRHLWRSIFIFAANICFFAGLAVNDMGVHVAIFFLAPLILTGMSVVFLGEQVGWRRWSAIVVGLAGGLLIIKPTPDAFNPLLLLPLAAAFLHATNQLFTRQLGRTENAAMMSASAQFTWIVLGFVMFFTIADGRFDPGIDHAFHPLFRAWDWPTAAHWPILGGIILLSTAGGYFVAQGYRLIPASTAAQYEYIALPLGVLWGMTIWGERPDALAWLGIVLVAGAGLYVFYRERLRGQKT